MQYAYTHYIHIYVHACMHTYISIHIHIQTYVNGGQNSEMQFMQRNSTVNIEIALFLNHFLTA